MTTDTRTTVAGLVLQVADQASAAAWVVSRAISRQPGDVHLVNAYTAALADRDRSFKDLLNRSEANFPDGRPLALIARRTSNRIGQVRGPSLFEDVLELGQEQSIRHYLLGGSPRTLSLLRENIQRRFPMATIVGAASPPFRDLTDVERAAQDEEIRQSGAQIVWVGLGTPKQDIEASRIASNLPVLAVAIGAAFDFLAGTKTEAPRFLSLLGLEWAFRLATEPRRLWRRYLFGNARFLKILAFGPARPRQRTRRKQVAQ